MPSWTSHLCFSTSRKIIIINLFWNFFVHMCVLSLCSCLNPFTRIFFIAICLLSHVWFYKVSFESPMLCCDHFWQYFHTLAPLTFLYFKKQSVHFSFWIIFLALWRVEGMKKCRDSFTITYSFHMPPMFIFCIASSFFCNSLSISRATFLHLL